MKEIKKNPYIAPTVKVVTFQVEKGFQASLHPQAPTTEVDRTHGEEMDVDATNRWGTF